MNEKGLQTDTVVSGIGPSAVGIGRAGLVAVLFCAAMACSSAAEFQGVDSAANWLARKGSMILPDPAADPHAHTLNGIAGAKFRQVRERFDWGAVNPAPGKFVLDWFLADCRAYAERGIAVDWIFHSAPGWTKPKGNLPTDLKALYELCRKLASVAPDGTSWEFWNEEDIDLCKASAWDYVTAAKVAYLGFKAGRPDAPALMGALCKTVDGPYNRTLFANDLGLYTDAFNFHVYATPSDYAGLLSAVRNFCGTQGLGGRAIWVTENGTHQEGHSVKDGVMPGLKAHSSAQELLQAEFAVKSQVMMQMAGASRGYLFVFPPYNEREGAKDWGLMRRDGSFKPAVDWLREKNAALGGLKLEGELKRPAEGVRAFLYRARDGRQTVVYWAESAVDHVAEINAEAERPIERPFTLPLADGSSRQLVARRRPAYLGDVHGLKPVTSAVPEGTLGVSVPKDIDPTLVLKVDIPEAAYVLADSKSAAEVMTNEVSVLVDIWNFGDSPKTVTLVCAAGRLSGSVKGIAVPAGGKATVRGLASPADPASDRSLFVLRAVGSSGRSSRLTVPFSNFALWRRLCREKALPWLKTASWRRNDSADRFDMAPDEPEKAMRFDLAWDGTASDRWAYPELKFDSADAKGAQYLVFEVRSMQDKVENDFRCANVIVEYEDGSSNFLGFDAPVGAWETRRVRLRDGVGLKALKIGMNPNGRKLSYWIRNISLLRR